MSRRILGAAAVLAVFTACSPASAVTYYGPWHAIVECEGSEDCEPANFGQAVRNVIHALKTGDEQLLDEALAALRDLTRNNQQLADLANIGPTPGPGLGGGFGGGGAQQTELAGEDVFTIASVPLPASFLLLGSALAGLGLLTRRRSI